MKILNLTLSRVNLPCYGLAEDMLFALDADNSAPKNNLD
jgi:hypothetical protein